MLPFLTIDQAALAPWAAKIDAKDAMIVALVRTLDPRNPKVKRLMVGDYFMLTTAYVMGQLPTLGLAPETLTTRLSKLCKLGLVDRLIVFNKRTGHRCRYVKLSDLYYQSEERVQKAASGGLARAREYTGVSAGTLPAHSPDDQKTMIKEGPPPSYSTTGGGPQEEEKTFRASFAASPLAPAEERPSDSRYQEMLQATAARILAEKRPARHAGFTPDQEAARRALLAQQAAILEAREAGR